MRAFRIIGKTAVAFYEELFHYFLMGLINIVAWLLVIPGPFALTGIYAIGQRAVRGEGVKWGEIWDTIKEFGPRALLLFVTVVAGYAVIGMNIWFYNNPDISPFPASVAVWVTPLWIVLGLIWTGVMFYAQAFLMELKEPRFLLVLRNSLFLTVLHPLDTLLWIVIIALLAALSVVLPVLIIITPGFITVLSLTAVRTLVADLTERAEAMQAKEEGESEEEEQEEAVEEEERADAEEEEYEPIFFPLGEDYEEEIEDQKAAETITSDQDDEDESPDA
jgi:uncharacterized membrane protein YesL